MRYKQWVCQKRQRSEIRGRGSGARGQKEKQRIKGKVQAGVESRV